MIVALSAMFLLVTSLGPLGNSLWFDELHSVMSFINPGPSGIWGGYTPNDHMLFELLSWATVSLLGDHSDAAYRIWGVVPAVGGVALAVWWLWRRFGQWMAAVFAVLASTAPLHMGLAVQARGYGLGFLASVVMLIGADMLGREPTRRAQIVFAGGSLLGILTLATFVMPFGALSLILFALRPQMRRDLIRLAVIVGGVSLVWYAPVISSALHQTSNVASNPVPLYSVFGHLFEDLLAPSVNLIATTLSLTPSAIIGGVVLTAGAVAMWRRWERLLMALTIVPAFVTYLLFGLLRLDLANRYMSILLLPLLMPCAFAFADTGMRLAARSRLLAVAVAVVAVAGTLALLKGGDDYYNTTSSVPIEDWQGAAAVVTANPGYSAVTNSTNYPELDYYTNRSVTPFGAGRVARAVCSNTPIVYVEHIRPHLAWLSSTCLVRRHATEIKLAQLRYRINVWVAPAPATTAKWCLSHARQTGAPAHATPLAKGTPFQVTLPVNGLAISAQVTIVQAQQAPSFTGSGGTTFEAQGEFVALEYRVKNTGGIPFKPALLNQQFGVVGSSFNVTRTPALTWVPIADSDSSCPNVTSQYAASQRLTSPSSVVKPGQTVDTLGLYAVAAPAWVGLARQATPSLTLASSSLSRTMPLGALQ